MPFVISEETRIYYEVHGDKEPLLLLHGNGEDSSFFQPLTSLLEKHYMVILMDTRGHGQSSMGSKKLCFPQFAEDVKVLLDHLECTNVHILGFSDGANIAMQFARRYPNNINTLILNGGNLTPAGIKRSIQYPIMFGYGVLSLFALFLKASKAKKAIMALMIHHPNLQPSQLSNIHMPTLVIVGDRDMVKRAHSLTIVEALPHGSFVEMKGTHFIARDEYEVFYQHVHTFIQDHTS